MAFDRLEDAAFAIVRAVSTHLRIGQAAELLRGVRGAKPVDRGALSAT